MSNEIEKEKHLDHVERPRLPWRTAERLTECGLSADQHPTISRESLRQRFQERGRTRTYMLTCVTCLGAAERHRPWEESPVEAMARECERGQYRDAIPLIQYELLALAHLVEAHGEEFNQLVQAHMKTVTLAEARLNKRRGFGL